MHTYLTEQIKRTVVGLDMLSRKLNKEYLVIAFLFLVSFGYEYWYYFFHQDLTTFTSIVGVPFSDASNWYMMAKNLTNGLGYIGPYSSLRPFYAIFLSWFYVWFGPSFVVGKLANIVVGSLSMVFLYLIGKLVFNRIMGISLALAFLMNAHILQDSQSLMTEQLGLCLFIISIYYLIKGTASFSVKLLFWSGIFIGLSNVTRTMTIPALPLYVVILGILFYKRFKSVGRPLVAIGSLIGGVAIILIPWLVRQYATFGIFNISTNINGAWYAATSPQYKVWSHLIYMTPEYQKLTTVKQQEDYFRQLAIKNLIAYPTFYADNVMESMVTFFTQYRFTQNKIIIGFLTLFVLLGITRPSFALSDKVLLTGLLFVFTLHLRAVPPQYDYVFAVVGILVSFKNTKSWPIFTSLLMCGLGSALMAHASVLDRLFLMVFWLFDAYYIYAVYFLFSQSTQRIIKIKPSLQILDSDTFATASLSKGEARFIRILSKGAVVSVALFISISSGEIWYRTWQRSQVFALHTVNTPLSLNLSIDTQKEILFSIPDIEKYITSTERGSLGPELYTPVTYDNDYVNQGKLAVIPITISEFLYHYPSGQSHWLRLFEGRQYDRTVIYSDLARASGLNYFIAPGFFPNTMIGKSYYAVGRVNVDMGYVYQSRKFVELIALVSEDRKEIITFKDDKHLQILNQLSDHEKTDSIPLVINKLVPDSTKAGVVFWPLPGQPEIAVITVYGKNFDARSTISWDGQELATTLGDSTWLTGTVDKSLYSIPGKHEIRIINKKSNYQSNAFEMKIYE